MRVSGDFPEVDAVDMCRSETQLNSSKPVRIAGPRQLKPEILSHSRDSSRSSEKALGAPPPKKEGQVEKQGDGTTITDCSHPHLL